MKNLKKSISKILKTTFGKNCKIIFPSTHVVYEGVEKVKKDILEDEDTKPILSYANSKATNEKQLKNSGKTDEIANKISLGKIKKFKDGNTLMTQDWVMEPKKKVKDIIADMNIPNLIIKEFARIKVGE